MHISRKQRILQESAKSAAQEGIKSPSDGGKSSLESSKSAAQTLVNFKEATYTNESQIHANTSFKVCEIDF